MTGQCQATIDVLLELTKKLATEPALEAALTAVTEAALELLPCEHSSVRVFDETRAALLSSARSGLGRTDGPMTFRSGEGVIGWVGERGEALRLDDASKDPRFKRGPAQGFHIRSMLAVPLRAGDQIVGVLGMTASSAGVFTVEHETLATLLANCAVPAIDKARLERIKAKLEDLAVKDPQTAAYNQRYLLPRLREELDRARRHRSPLSLLLMDLDRFKSVNDTFGHATGDVVLRSFADRVLQHVRTTDVLVRRGGDEFVLLMPHASDERAAEVGERIRAAVADEPFRCGHHRLTRTVSIGVATWSSVESAEELEARADQAMYEAKRRGRNLVVEAFPSSGPASPPPYVRRLATA